MKVLSLFDGISAGMVALERAGIDVEYYIAYEIDKYAIEVSKHNYPQIKHCGDVTTADFTQYSGFDLLCGGSPCQDISITQSKKRQGLEGSKSNLFWEFVRAKNESKAKYFLFENVGSMSKDCENIISEALGVEPISINSNLFSAQDRDRKYWTNISVTELPKYNPIVLSDILDDEVENKYFYECGFDYHGDDKKVCASVHLKGHDILKRVYSPKFKCGTLTTCGGGNTQKKVYQNGKCRKLTPLEYERLQTLPDNYTNCVSDSRRYSAIGNSWTVDVISHIFKGLKKGV